MSVPLLGLYNYQYVLALEMVYMIYSIPLCFFGDSDRIYHMSLLIGLYDLQYALGLLGWYYLHYVLHC